MSTNTFSTRDASHVTKFNGNNFPFWKFQVLLVLRQYDLVDVVLGTQVKPTPTMSTASPPTVTYNAEITLWMKKDNSASCCIVATIEENFQRSLINCKSSKEMWDRLAAQYEQAASENKYFLQQRFYNYSFQQGHDVMSYITEIETLANQLGDLGEIQSENQIITKVLCTLPPSFRSVVSAWENVEEAKKKLPLLTTRLLKEESLNKMHESEESAEDKAFFSRRSNQVRPKDAQSSKKIDKRICYFCDPNGKTGHIEERCWVKHGRPTRSLKNADAALSQHHTEWPLDYGFSSHITSYLSSTCRDPKNWFADSGASQHMSDQRWMFSTFNTVINGSYPVKGIGSNNSPLQATGRGDIFIKSKVNGEWKNNTIHDALFVPKLGANLFSIRAAARRETKILFDDEGVSITHHSSIVATGTSKGTNLYLLDFEPVNRGEPFDQSTILHVSSFKNNSCTNNHLA